jgi:hypothetical protein
MTSHRFKEYQNAPGFVDELNFGSRWRIVAVSRAHTRAADGSLDNARFALVLFIARSVIASFIVGIGRGLSA